MSVFWDDGRKELETFARNARQPTKEGPSPFNYFVEPEPDQLLRVSVGFGFRRARLRYAYALLRGKDLETEKFSPEQRDKQFAILQEAQKQTLNLQNWHGFLGALQQSGFRGAAMVSSKITLFFSYTFYLIGKVHFGVESFVLYQAIGRWFFMASLTSRYTSSPETTMERDLASLRTINTADAFIGWIDKTIASELTEDFWKVTLPNRLDTSSPTSPLLYAYYAALNLMEARALFSKKKVRDALDPSTKANRSTVERHHLFPRNYLADLGIKSSREVNQIANYAFVEWNDNIAIADSPPVKYFPLYCERFAESDLAQMRHWHALPDGWENMDYLRFLEARRILIATVIREGFLHLSRGEVIADESRTLDDLIAAGEGVRTEFKSTLRVNLHTREKDPKMEHAILRTIVGFLNSHGGTLIIGVNDDGEILGLQNDAFESEDKMDLHLGNLIKARMGASTMLYISPRFETLGAQRVLVVDCKPSKVPVFLKNGTEEEFFVRAGASSAALPPSQMNEYIKQRFPLISPTGGPRS